jgi:hypothetical protein
MEYRVFILTMPSNNAWNGKWTGEGRLFCIVKRYQKNSPILKNVDKSNCHYYDFGDGWGAFVKIERIDADKAKLYRKKSKGFYGYDWMVNEIEEHGRILSRTEREGGAQ